MLYIERKYAPCSKTIIQRYTNRHTNGVPQLGAPCFKVTPYGISLEIMNEVFKLREETHYHLRHTTQVLV